MADTFPPKTMRAWTFSNSGKPSQILHLDNAHPVPPHPTGDKLLIQVSYVGLTSAGVNLMRDIPSVLRKGAIPEMDFSGRVVLAGSSVESKFSPGTRVFGTANPVSAVLSGTGTLAEYISIPSNLVQVVPSKMHIRDGATLGGLAQTGQKMVDNASVSAGHRVLIHGASGGVGIIALQLAKARGATVVATCSERNVGMVKAAGADEIIDYKANAPLHTHVMNTYSHRPFDSILDAVGSQDLYQHCPAYLNRKGIYVNVGSEEDASQRRTFVRWARNSWTPSILGGIPRTFNMFGGSVTPDGVRKLAESAERGELRVFVDSVFKMGDVLEGYDRMQSRKAVGRILVEMEAQVGQDEL